MIKILPKLVIALAFAFSFFTFTALAFAQDSTQSATPSATSNTTTNTTSKNIGGPESSKSSTASGQVLGGATKLGETSTEKRIAQIAIALIAGSAAFFFGFKTLRSSAEE